MVTIRAILATIAVIPILTSAAAETPTRPDVTGRVLSCKAILDDAQRLKCFDDLFGKRAGLPPAVTEPEMEWSLEERNAEGGPEVTAAVVAGDTALILRCKDQNTEAAFSTKYNYLGSNSVNMLVRINDQEPTKEVWSASTNGRAAFAPDAIAFISALPDNAKLVIRTTRSDGKTKEGIFQTGALAGIKDKIARACNWPDPEPIGSTGHSERP